MSFPSFTYIDLNSSSPSFVAGAGFTADGNHVINLDFGSAYSGGTLINPAQTFTILGQITASSTGFGVGLSDNYDDSNATFFLGAGTMNPGDSVPFTFIMSAAQADAFGAGSFSFQVTGANSEGTDVDTITVNIALCFAAGTGITTPQGEVPVEHLRIGDTVCTAEGGETPVKWVGIQRLNMLWSGRRKQPVRIRAGALGDGLPHRDLTLTGDHGLIVDGLLVNAAALVNGDSIDWVPLALLPSDLTVYHVETENHEVILANGVPAESFIDYAGRKMFDNHAEYLDLYGAERLIPEMAAPRISTARLLPEPTRERLGIGTGEGEGALSA